MITQNITKFVIAIVLAIVLTIVVTVGSGVVGEQIGLDTTPSVYACSGGNGGDC